MNYASLFADVVSTKTLTRDDDDTGCPYGLSEEQKAALRGNLSSSATVIAGAGAGKTTLLVERTAALIRAGVDPQRLAVVTFTRRAAHEISERVRSRLGARARLPVCGTVHALALAGLRKEGVEVRLATETEQAALLDVLRQELSDDMLELSDSELLLELNRCREEERFNGEAGLAALRYEELLVELGLQDFTSLLRLGLNVGVSRFEHLLVDEAQDLSRLQMSFLKACGRESARYWYIGDADQSIYAFRGADDGVMQELTRQVDENFVLSTNYRCAPSILAHANNVIQFNENRLPVKWRAHRTDSGEVAVRDFEHGEDELDAVAQWLKAKPGRAVLARTQALIAPLKELELPAYTVHESKGLEWPEVWVMGCEAALFPHPLAAKEEERRLFYVAMTRARDALILSYASSRARSRTPNSRQPSPFLFEAQGLSA